jgi:hypothetical protein
MVRKGMNETTTQDWNGKLHVSNNNFDAAKLLSALQNRIIVNMDAQASAEALSGLYAYYKVGSTVLSLPNAIELMESGRVEDFRRQRL